VLVPIPSHVIQDECDSDVPVKLIKWPSLTWWREGELTPHGGCWGVIWDISMLVHGIMSS